jgi:2-C-methyl-D-erythritol 4-phosphate cytidylyltransferase
MNQDTLPLAPLALIAAGGEGKRLGASGPKALVRCAGRSLLAWSLDGFAAAASFAAGRVVVAAHASDLDAFDAEVAPFRDFGLDVTLCEGGASRSHSVRNALIAAGALDRVSAVLVHDAARPLTGSALIDACVAGVAGDVEALVPAAAVTDTIKQTDEGGVVVATLDRSSLWAVQTPQAFRPVALANALQIDGAPDDARLSSATDDASLVEAAGGLVKILPWQEPNPKVTTAADLELVASLLEAPR